MIRPKPYWEIIFSETENFVDDDTSNIYNKSYIEESEEDEITITERCFMQGYIAG